MTRAFLSGVSLEVPEGWQDQSLLTLVGPRLDSPGLLRAKRDEPEHASIVMKRQSVSEKAPSLEELAEAQEAMMAKVMPGSRVLDRGVTEVGEQKIRALTRELALPRAPASGEIRQIQIYFFIGTSFFVLAGSGPNDLRFDAIREKVLSVARGLRIHGA